MHAWNKLFHGALDRLPGDTNLIANDEVTAGLPATKAKAHLGGIWLEAPGIPVD